MNTQIYFCGGKVTNMYTNSICKPYFLNADIFVSSLKHVSKMSLIIPIGLENIFGCPRIDRKNIQIYLQAQELTKQICLEAQVMTKQIFEYIQMKERP